MEWWINLIVLIASTILAFGFAMLLIKIKRGE